MDYDGCIALSAQPTSDADVLLNAIVITGQSPEDTPTPPDSSQLATSPTASERRGNHSDRALCHILQPVLASSAIASHRQLFGVFRKKRIASRPAKDLLVLCFLASVYHRSPVGHTPWSLKASNACSVPRTWPRTTFSACPRDLVKIIWLLQFGARSGGTPLNGFDTALRAPALEDSQVTQGARLPTLASHSVGSAMPHYAGIAGTINSEAFGQAHEGRRSLQDVEQRHRRYSMAVRCRAGLFRFFAAVLHTLGRCSL